MGSTVMGAGREPDAGGKPDPDPPYLPGSTAHGTRPPPLDALPLRAYRSAALDGSEVTRSQDVRCFARFDHFRVQSLAIRERLAFHVQVRWCLASRAISITPRLAPF